MPEAVVDTVVLRYFLLVDEVDLLLKLLGSPMAVPRIVFDPDEGQQTPDEARSEITRSISYQQKASRDPARDEDGQNEAARNAVRLQAAVSLYEAGTLSLVDLDQQELDLVGRLTSPTTCKEFGLRFPLDPGEAACVAIAVQRDLVLVTDDTDALRALERHRAGHAYERIRRLLIRAAESKLCTRKRANEIHHEMRRLGFWDDEEPFPSG
ncbi:MAG: hypothetical protein M3203_14105 [Actinomycetota bacterium]|nr:hypothetical protein [Actinomycetota bacterium]